MSLAIETVSYMFSVSCLVFLKVGEDFLQCSSTVCCIDVILYIDDVI